ncbi:hypothetical protein [Inediibacterium massiliense]|uniref:hypothetical protein n=1 Tax=Inediibacterium massiliense TaxID=1658111 RepID=UPI0006B4C569|nr:hypothetical protein [Inediibacterium massiliense]
MDITNLFAVGAAIGLAVGGGFLFYHYKKKNLEKLFTQTYEMTKQIPKQKKNSFVLLMFRASLLSARSNKDKASISNKLNNPKYVNMQLMQMSNILKDQSKVHDKTMKRALNLLSAYQTWEIAKLTKDKQVIQDKAS